MANFDSDVNSYLFSNFLPEMRRVFKLKVYFKRTHVAY